MNCAKVRNILPLIAGGEIDPTQRQETEQHLLQCSECRRAVKEYEVLVGLSRSAPPVEISDETGTSLIRDVLAQTRDTRPGEFTSGYRDVTKKYFRFRYRLAGVTAVIAIGLIAIFVAFGTQIFRGSRGTGVEDYLLRSDLRGLSGALQDENSRQRLLDETISVDLLIQTVENLQRNRTFHRRIEHQIEKSLQEMKNNLRESPASNEHDGSHPAYSLLTCAKTDDDRIRLEKILRTLRCLRRSDDRITVRDILRGLAIANQT